ncbi:MAG: family 10 glycosylhydrolase, partial [Planctomycetes bacterium]|nr:family 10 glycosylhydrolase [Planctomycetota bacterium]
SATGVHDQLAEAYLLAQPSRAKEGRAWWNHSGTGAYTGDWERTARELSDAGFNMVLPNMLWGGLAHYPSDLLPRSGTFREHGDQVAQCVAACRKHGIEVHVWKVNYNMSNAPRDFVAKMRTAGRTQVSADGQPDDWLCPSHPENIRLETDSMLEVARKYDVDGIHFDYIRYPGSRNCFCDGCRGRFESERGERVAQWPADCYSGALKETYTDWRCRQITKLVAAVHAQGKKLRPDLKISAAVFGSYPDCRRSVAQDWPVWVEAGYLDFICPMDYTESDLYFRTLVANQLRLVGGRIPVYPGIGATASRVSLSADRVVGQIHHARSLGAAGFTIFNLHRGTIDGIAPGVGLGATATPATPPHGGR